MENYTYKFKTYPSENQRQLLGRYFGCNRFVYNYYLNKSIQDYQQDKDRKRNFYEYKRDIVLLKKEHNWLSEMNSQSLQDSLANLDKAYNRFFTKKGGFPNFKKKNSKQSVKIPQNFVIQGNRIRLPKRDTLLKFRQDTLIQGNIKYLTITKDTDGKYYVSVSVEKKTKKLKKTRKEVGIDLGVKDLAITSDGKIYKTIKNKNEESIKETQKRLSKKQKGSRRYKQLKTKIAKLHKTDANRRADRNHKISIELIRDYDLIVFENLNVKGMMQNHCLAKSIGNQGRYDLITKVRYKAERYGKTFHQIDRFYPSSKQCSNCGNVKNHLSLSERTYRCEECGNEIDRDVNASINVLKYGKKELGF